MEKNFSFGYWLRRQRLARDLRQDDLAAQLGVATVTLRKLESDERRPSLQLIARIAEVFGLDGPERETLLRVARADLSPAALALPERAPSADPREPVVTAATALPSGAVTFLFTDIEGSSQLWEQHPQTMPGALARHDSILRAAVVAQGGHTFKTVGDAFCVAFADPRAALLAALEAQHHLAAELWPDTGPLRVRMALHSGVAEIRGGDYFGPTLNRVARLLSLAHGGQVLLAAPTAELLHDRLPEGARLCDLGLQRLKDLERPEQAYQLEAPGLLSGFPPLRGAVDTPHNLPAAPNPLIGREVELAEIRALLQRAELRLLTLLGPGGTGKTRLALQVAREQLGASPDGVWFVDLTPLREAGSVLPTIARTLGLRESAGQPVAEQLRPFLSERDLLLVLDNLEQVIDVAPQLAALLAAAPRLRIVATSREALRLAGEQIYLVPPLALPAEGAADPLSSPASQLFIARARAVRGDFSVDGAEAGAIAAICRRLDGLPLALELAAARTRLLAPQAILERLSRPLDLLTAGARDLPMRQRTLRATIAWSYELLSETEQVLFRRLGVFVGGWDLEAVEVVGACGADTLDILGGLLDKSLVEQVAAQGEARYRMLETLREYALERLVEGGEAEAAQERHAAHFLALAEAAELRGPGHDAWLRRLAAEHDNFKAMLAQLELRGDDERLARACVALNQYWLAHGHGIEGRHWAERALQRRHTLAAQPRLCANLLNGAGFLLNAQSAYAEARELLTESLALTTAHGYTPERVDALEGLGMTAWSEDDYPSAMAHWLDALAIARGLGDEYRSAWVAGFLSWSYFIQGEVAKARALAEESAATFRALGVRRLLGNLLSDLGSFVAAEGDYAYATELLAESIAIARQAGDLHTLATALNYYGEAERVLSGSGEKVIAALTESLSLFRALGDRRRCMGALPNLILATLELGDVSRTRELLADLFELSGQLESLQGFFWALRSAAELMLQTGQAERATRMFGAGEALREAHGIPFWPGEAVTGERIAASARAALGEESFAAALVAGRALSLSEATAEALK